MGWTTIITYCIYHIHKDVRTYAYIYNTTYLITFHKHTPHESPPVSPKSHQGETPENAKTEPTKPGWSFPTIGFFPGGGKRPRPPSRTETWCFGSGWLRGFWGGIYFRMKKTDVGCHWKMLFPVVGCSVKDLKNSGVCELWCLGNLLLVCCLGALR